MKQETKKSYSKPALRVHGDVETLTLQNGTEVNSDVPRGLSGTAYPQSS